MSGKLRQDEVRKSEKEHTEHLREVLSTLRTVQLYDNLKKCDFCTNQVVFWGFLVSSQGIQLDQAKVQVIRDWPTLTSLGSVRSFHSLVGSYRQFVQDFSTISSPLTDLTKNNTPFRWVEAQYKTLETLKDRLTQASLLVLPDLCRPFEVECDTSGIGIGGALIQ
ncbi:uncharacterized protein [Phyllobates terribilis]|uniref:uncharacterized protein n=1 Tax=Phyllobates terribilis TaxID=111132 RepID=UPI003CCB5446